MTDSNPLLPGIGATRADVEFGPALMPSQWREQPHRQYRIAVPIAAQTIEACDRQVLEVMNTQVYSIMTPGTPHVTVRWDYESIRVESDSIYGMEGEEPVRIIRKVDALAFIYVYVGGVLA